MWNNVWSIVVDSVELNNLTDKITQVPELGNLQPQQVVMVQRDGDYPVYVRSQPQSGGYTFLIALRTATTAALWDTAYAALVALFAPGVYHTLTAQVRGMPSAKSVKFITESMQGDFKTRTVVVQTVAPKPVLA